MENNQDKCDRDSCVALCDMYLGDLPICNSCFEELKKVIPPESRGSEMIVLVNDFMGGTKDYSRNFYLGSFEPKSQPTFWLLVVDAGIPHQFGRYDSRFQRQESAKEIIPLFNAETTQVFALDVSANGHPQFLTWNEKR